MRGPCAIDGSLLYIPYHIASSVLILLFCSLIFHTRFVLVISPAASYMSHLTHPTWSPELGISERLSADLPPLDPHAEQSELSSDPAHV